MRFLLILALLLVAVPVHATNYFVDATNGNNNNNGTSEETAWATFMKARDTINASGAAGDVVCFKDGTYTLTGSATSITRSGSAGNPITFKNCAGHAPVLMSGDWTNANNQMFKMTAAWWVIEGFEIKDVYYAFKIEFSNNIVIRRNVLHHTQRTAIQGTGHTMTITQNVIYDTADQTAALTTTGALQYAMYLTGKNNTVSYNVMYDTGGFCIQIDGGKSNSQPNTTYEGFGNGKIVHNTCGYTNYRGGMIFWVGSTASTAAHNTGIIVENNLFLQTCIDRTRVPCSASSHGSINTLNFYAADIQIKNNTSYNSLCTDGSCFFRRCTNSGCFSDGSTVATVSGNTTTTNPNLTNGPIQLTVPSAPDFTLTSSSTAAIDTGLSISGFAFNGSAPDAGAFESSTCATPCASIDLNVMDVQIGANLNGPLQNITAANFTVGCTGGANCGTPVVSTAALVAGTDSKIRLTLTGIGGGSNACHTEQTWTATYTAGTLTDSINVGGTLNQKVFTFSNQGVTEVCSGSETTPPAGGLIIQYDVDEGTGTTLADEVGGDQPGTMTNGPTWVGTSAINFVYQGDDYVAIPYGNAVNPFSQDLTFCMGVTPTAGTESSTTTIFGTQFDSDQLLYITKIGGTWKLGIQATGATSAATNLTVSAGPTRLCLVMDGGTATLYANAVAGTGEASRTYTSYALPSNLRFGLPQDFLQQFAFGGELDSLKVWTAALTPSEVSDDYAAWQQPAPSPTGTFAQVTHQWQLLRTPATNYRTTGATVSVVVGGAVVLVTQIDCTGADCDPTGARLYVSKNSGSYQAVSDVCQSDGVCFYGETSDVDIVSGTVECCLSGALTENDGPTNFTASAVPVFDLAQNGSFVRRSILKFGASVTAGDSFCFKEYHQTDLELSGGYTPTAGACATIVGVSAGIGF